MLLETMISTLSRPGNAAQNMRSLALEILKEVTGLDFGHADWRRQKGREKLASWEKVRAAWQSWWADHRDEYPKN